MTYGGSNQAVRYSIKIGTVKRAGRNQVKTLSKKQYRGVSKVSLCLGLDMMGGRWYYSMNL